MADDKDTSPKNYYTKFTARISAVEERSARNEERIKSIGREIGDIKRDLVKMEAIMENAARDSNANLNSIRSDFTKHRIQAENMNGKIDSLLEFKGDAKGLLKATIAKSIAIASGVLIFLALAIILTIQLIQGGTAST